MDIWEFCMYLTLGEYKFFSIKNENIALGIIMQYINVQHIVQLKLLRGDLKWNIYKNYHIMSVSKSSQFCQIDIIRAYTVRN